MKNYTNTITVEGNKTVYALLNQKTGEVFLGEATCSPQDKKNYNVGIAIAKHRAHLLRCESDIANVENAIQELTEALAVYRKKLEGLEYEKDSREFELDELIYGLRD